MRRVLVGLGLSLILAVISPVRAGQVIQTYNMGATLTDISGGAGVGTFDYWQSTAHPGGAVLTSVQLQISVLEGLQALSVTNNDLVNPQTFSYVTYSNIFSAGTAPVGDKNALKAALNANGGIMNGNIDLFDTGPVLYGPGQTIVYSPPAVFVGDDSLLVNSINFASYDTTGSFTLGFTTTTFQAFAGGGGNGSNTQITDATAMVKVIYNYDVPEPASLSIIGLGALALIRRRRA